MSGITAADCSFRVLKSCDEALAREIFAIYREAGFLDGGESWEYIPRMVAGSFVFVGVFFQDKLIAVARALSDGVSDAYIQDVAVHTAYRQRGVGSAMVKFIVAHLQNCGVMWIGLVGVAGSGQFYGSLGFKPLAGMTPMRFDF